MSKATGLLLGTPLPGAADLLLSALALPLLLLDRQAAVLGGTAPAFDLLQHHPALEPSADRLCPLRLAGRRALARALERLREDTAMVALRLSGASEEDALLVVMRRLRDHPGTCIASLTPIGTASPADAAWIASTLGLTRAEARAAALLTAGLRPPDIAERLGRSQKSIESLLDSAQRKLRLPGREALIAALAQAFVPLTTPGCDPAE